MFSFGSVKRGRAQMVRSQQKPSQVAVFEKNL
jgi:hypothetical protein